MSVTVVVTRDYDNVPTCFEKYELGTQWRVNGGNLEIFAGRTLAALYPSGNWVSVFVDDAMQVHKGSGKPDYATMPSAGGSPGVDVTPDSTADLADGSLDLHVAVPANQPVLDPADTPWTAATDSDADRDVVPLTAAGTFFPDDVTDRRAGKIPVAFRPRRYRTTPPPATKAPTGPRLLPLRLRMRQLAQDAASSPATPPAAGTTPTPPRMLPVTMRTTIYRAARPKPDEPAPDTDPAAGGTEPERD